MTDTPIALGELSCPRCGKKMLGVSFEGSTLVFQFSRGGETHTQRLDLRPMIQAALAAVIAENLGGGSGPGG